MEDDKNTPAPSESTFEQKVNSILDEAKTGEDGKLVLPEDLDEATQFAVMAEKRRRDTQASFTKTQQENKVLRAQNEEVLTRWEQAAVSALSAAAQDDLEQLKHDDPDAWRAKLTELEAEARQKFNEERENVITSAKNKSEIEIRAEKLAAFQEANPGVEINDDVIENDIPPRFVKQLENGDISFDEFLQKCGSFLTGGKVLEPGAKGGDGLTLDKLGGGNRPDDRAVDSAAKETYNDEIY